MLYICQSKQINNKLIFNKQTTIKIMVKVSKKQEISRKILPTLKKLDLYGKAYFEMRRVSTVSASIQRIQSETEDEKRFSYSTDKEEKVVTVIRTK